MAQSSFSLERSEVHEERNFLWKIPNFTVLYNVAKEGPDQPAQNFAKEEFSTGERSIGIQTNWRFYLKRINNGGGDEYSTVEIYLEFLGPGCYSAEYEVELQRSSDKRFAIVGSKSKREFATCNSKYSTIDGAVSECKIMLGTMKALSKNYLLEDELQLKIKFKVYYPSEIHCKGDLSTDFKKGLDSAVGSDVTFLFVEAEGSKNVIAEIKAHKSTLSFRSRVFAKMFESGMTEATDGKITISDMTPGAMRILLNFVYTGVVDPEWISVAGELIRAADKYELDEFKKFLCENIFFALTPKNVYKIWDLGELYKLPKVVETTKKFMKDNFDEFFPLHGMFVREEQDVLMEVQEPGS